MKIALSAPFDAVRHMGGATFEPGTGWWSQASEKSQQQYGNPFRSERDAIYIPTLQKTGHPVDEAVVSSLKIQAAALGLTSITQAAGMWVLSETSEVQTETIWIAYSATPITQDKRPALKALAETTKILANQDEVAREESGCLYFTAFELEAVEFEIKSSTIPTSRLWVVPISDLETAEVRDLLQDAGEAVISFPGWWGMKWEHIPTSSREKIKSFLTLNSEAKVYGVKLAGDCEWLAEIIEPYQPGRKSPLQKVAQIVSAQLTDYQKSVVVNTTTWIPGLKNLELAQGVIDAIRLSDRASQGINPDQEAQAVRAWENRKEIGQLTIVRMPHSKCATITDRFYGQYENVLIIGGDQEINLFGGADLCAALKERFPEAPSPWGGSANCWAKIDGNLSFWGGYSTSEEVEAFILEFLK